MRVLIVTAALFAWTAGEAGDARAVAAHRGRSATAWVATVDSLLSAENHGRALAIVDSLLPLLEGPGGDARAAGILRLRRGGILTTTGHAREGGTDLRQGIVRARSRGDSASVAYGLRWLGVGLDMQGRIEEARAVYEYLLSLGRSRGDRSCEAWGQVGLAWRAIQEGVPAVPVTRYEEAIRLFHADGNRRGEAWAENGLGNALAREGTLARAADAYRRAGALAREAGYSLVEVMAMTNLGNVALNLGDPGLAASSYERAIGLQLRGGVPREGTVPLINLAFCRRQLGSIDEAESCLAIADECARGYPELEGMVLGARAELRSDQGRHRGAASFYRKAYRIGDALPLKNRVECLVGLGHALAAQDSLGAGLDCVLRARSLARPAGAGTVKLLVEASAAALLASAGRQEEALATNLRAEAAARDPGHRSLRIDLLAQAGRAAAALAMPDSAMHLYEDAAAAWESERAVPIDPEWRAQRGRQGNAIGTELARLLLDRPTGQAEEVRTARAFERLQRFKGRTLVERMTGPGAAPLDRTGEGNTPGYPSLRAVQADLLREGDLLLDVHVGPRTSLVFAITRDSCRWAELPAEPRLATACAIVRESILADLWGHSDSLALSSALGALGGWLLDPFHDLVAGARCLQFSPDGPLCTLPVTLLPDPSTGEPLLDRVECRIVPSVRALARARGAVPDGQDARDGAVLALAGARDAGGRPLASAAAEVQALARRYRRVAGFAAQSSETLPPAERIRAGRYDVLHIAAHVEVNDQSPWRSALCLSTDSAGGRITAFDVSAMRLPHRLVVLSGCETARGRALNGEGVQGLSAAFLSSGAQCVVASLWPAPDRETAALMRLFYEGLSRGETAGEALRRAQIAMRRSPASRAPLYWSGFLAIGAGEVRVDLSPRRAGPPPGILIITGLLILSGVVVAALAHRGALGRGTKGS